MLRNRGLRHVIAMLDGFRDRRIRTTIGAALLVACGLTPLQARATLLLSPDGTTVYDTVNNISWLGNADLAATNRFGLPLCTGPGTQPCVNASGSMRYDAAVAWVQATNAANYLGHSNWQLPTTPANDSGCGKTGPQGAQYRGSHSQHHGRAIQQFPTLSLLVAVGRSSPRRQSHFLVRHRLVGRQYAA